MFPFILLAVQAAGLAANIWQAKKANKLDKQGLQFSMQGLKMQQRELDLKMQQEQLASSQESLYNTDRLRDIMSTQRAIFAARGQSSAQGSNFFIGQNSINLFNEDENARKLAMGFKQHYTNINKTLLSMEGSRMELDVSTRKSERYGKLISQATNMFSSNSLGSFGSGGGNNINDNLQSISNGNWQTGGGLSGGVGRKGAWMTGTNVSDSWRTLGRRSASGLNG